MAIQTLGPYNAEDIAHSPALIFTIIFFTLAFVGFSLMALLAPAGSQWRSIILPQLASGVLYVLMWFIFNGSNVFSVLLLTIPAAGPIIAAIYLSVLECVHARKRARERALTRSRIGSEVVDEEEANPETDEATHKPPKLRLRSMSTVGNFGESSVPLSNLPRGTTQRFYSVYADSPEGEGSGGPVLNICPVQDCTVTVLEAVDTSEDDDEVDAEPAHGKAVVTPIDDSHSLKVEVCETADKSLAFTVQLHRRNCPQKNAKIDII
ncbi:hypothetical protein Pmar_PMAR026027 [Perkinsus marinus ATCC 50983]|uniref:Uncharacterized protein n=1 Tax=Perkinsus marinus (strain ATCC 50983 / TXsc) TaxID=423536 RepID=C5LK81_PERM5|nr:hypothetical protein Pmar_PMAR026027 [Perkinsus marinus ATCC 50983]EER02868.1 hypothetical protein Pmar_PMAR026027 [Perkinsus marinus ATCC 50983]|eukprot:XP_002771052.1 hypothetical protein Pmar_PMAR026027 [Perkinsus marinus ATCC 50983]